MHLGWLSYFFIWFLQKAGTEKTQQLTSSHVKWMHLGCCRTFPCKLFCPHIHRKNPTAYFVPCKWMHLGCCRTFPCLLRVCVTYFVPCKMDAFGSHILAYFVPCKWIHLGQNIRVFLFHVKMTWERSLLPPETCWCSRCVGKNSINFKRLGVFSKTEIAKTLIFRANIAETTQSI
jgi:hypothetical protein